MVSITSLAATAFAHDSNKGTKWVHMAADQGYAAAQSDLASALQTGEGVDKDLEQSREWYFRAATNGHAGASVH